MYKKKSIILTGGAGFIGSHAYVKLLESGYKPIIIDNFSNAKLDVVKNLKKLTSQEVNFYELDCTKVEDICKVFEKEKPSAVMHFAALKSVSESQASPISYYNNNINSLISIIIAMQSSDCKNIIFSSSATVYDEVNDLPLTEESLLGYKNPYGHSKLICEQIIQEASKSNKLNYGILRYFNPVGAHKSGLIGENPQGVPNNLMPYVALVASGDIESVNIYGNDYPTHDGTGVRDYIHISDLISGHIASLRSLEITSDNHTVNLGTGIGYSVLDLINSYSKASKKDIPLVYCSRREGDIAACYADNKKAKDLLGWEPKYSLDDMCNSSWNWVSSND
jgi:UDP-glucose 4-epimerase